MRVMGSTATFLVEEENMLGPPENAMFLGFMGVGDFEIMKK